MKKLLGLIAFTFIATVQAKDFTPASGVVIKCHDSVSNYQYYLKIVDLGDEEGEVKVYTHKELVTSYNNVFFNENSKGSLFIVLEDGRELFSVIFPENNLEEAYYEGRADSTALDCKLIKK